MKISQVTVVYDEDISQCRRAIENLRPVCDDLIIICHKGAPQWVRDYLKSEARSYLEIDLDEFDSPEQTKNLGIRKVKHLWVFVLDPDEFVTKEVVDEIASLRSDCPYNYFVIDRVNIKYWENETLEFKERFPDPQIRFFKRNYRREGKVHCIPNVSGPVRRFSGFMVHDWLTGLKVDITRRWKLYEKLRQEELARVAVTLEELG